MLNLAQPRFAAALRFFRDSKTQTPSVSAWRAALRLGFDDVWREKWDANRSRASLSYSPCLSRWLELADQSAPKWDRFKNIYRGQTIVCAGNGPSLNDMDLSPLDGKVVIGANHAFKLLERITPSHFHAMVQDPVRLVQIEPELGKFRGFVHLGTCGFGEENMPLKCLDKLGHNFSVYLPKSTWEPDEMGNYSPSPIWDNGCATDPRTGFFYGFSIIFSTIQLAAFLGAKRIACIGIEMDYSKQANFAQGVQHLWPQFSYETHAKSMFETLRDKLSERGIELVNCTPGGKVDVLKRSKLQETLS